MKSKVFLTMVLLFAMCSFAFAASLQVTWNANQETDIAGYKVLYTTPTDSGWNLVEGKWVFSGTAWTHVQDVGNVLTYTIPNIVVGPYAVGVKAYDTASNVSEMSIPATAYYTTDAPVIIPPIDVPPGKPIQIIINVQK
jgi:hypothetical protein